MLYTGSSVMISNLGIEGGGLIMNPSIGQAIKAARKARGWTQRQLAEAAGVALVTIKTLEADKYIPRGETLRQLAGALGVSVDSLMGTGAEDILAGAFPAATLRDLGLTDAFLRRYADLWPDLNREQRAWVVGHLRIMADAERKIRALEGRAPRGEPDGTIDPPGYPDIIPGGIKMQPSTN